MEGRLQKDLKEALKIEAFTCGNSCHRAQVLSAVRTMGSVQRRKKRIGFLEFMLRQIPFIGRDIWMLQGGTAFAVSLVLYLSVGGNLQYFPVHCIPPFLGIMAIALVMTSVPLMLRSYRYQMHEIELASRMSHMHLFSSYLAVLAAEYLAVFAFGTGVSVCMAGLPMAKAAVYFALPLFMASGGCVQLIRRTGGWERVAQRLGVCEGYCVVLAAGLVLLYDMKQAAYDSTGMWAALAFAGFAFLSWSVCTWVKESSYL